MIIFKKDPSWEIRNEYEGTSIEFEGSRYKANELFVHVKAISPGSKLYRNGRLVK